MLRFTNIDKEDFVAVLGGVETVIKAGESIDVDNGVARFYAKHLSTKMQLRDTGDFAENDIKIALMERMVSEAPLPGEAAPSVPEAVPETPAPVADEITPPDSVPAEATPVVSEPDAPPDAMEGAPVLPDSPANDVEVDPVNQPADPSAPITPNA